MQLIFRILFITGFFLFFWDKKQTERNKLLKELWLLFFALFILMDISPYIYGFLGGNPIYAPYGVYFIAAFMLIIYFKNLR